jgi:hypothetical protein
MGQPTLSGDRRMRCLTCGAVLHTINGVVRHYGSDAACHKIMDLNRQLLQVREAMPHVMRLLNRIGSWTGSRWDQHLRYDIGDKKADAVIAALAACEVALGTGGKR